MSGTVAVLRAGSEGSAFEKHAWANDLKVWANVRTERGGYGRELVIGETARQDQYSSMYALCFVGTPRFAAEPVAITGDDATSPLGGVPQLRCVRLLDPFAYLHELGWAGLRVRFEPAPFRPRVGRIVMMDTATGCPACGARSAECLGSRALTRSSYLGHGRACGSSYLIRWDRPASRTPWS